MSLVPCGWHSDCSQLVKGFETKVASRPAFYAACVLAKLGPILSGQTSFESPVGDAENQVGATNNRGYPACHRRNAELEYITHQSAQPHQPCKELIGTADDLAMIVVIRLQAISRPYTRARLDPANQ